MVAHHENVRLILGEELRLEPVTRDPVPEDLGDPVQRLRRPGPFLMTRQVLEHQLAVLRREHTRAQLHRRGRGQRPENLLHDHRVRRHRGHLGRAEAGPDRDLLEQLARGLPVALIGGGGRGQRQLMGRLQGADLLAQGPVLGELGHLLRGQHVGVRAADLVLRRIGPALRDDVREGVLKRRVDAGLDAGQKAGHTAECVRGVARLKQLRRGRVRVLLQRLLMRGLELLVLLGHPDVIAHALPAHLEETDGGALQVAGRDPLIPARDQRDQEGQVVLGVRVEHHATAIGPLHPADQEVPGLDVTADGLGQLGGVELGHQVLAQREHLCREAPELGAHGVLRERGLDRQGHLALLWFANNLLFLDNSHT